MRAYQLLHGLFKGFYSWFPQLPSIYNSRHTILHLMNYTLGRVVITGNSVYPFPTQLFWLCLQRLSHPCRLNTFRGWYFPMWHWHSQLTWQKFAYQFFQTRPVLAIHVSLTATPSALKFYTRNWPMSILVGVTQLNKGPNPPPRRLRGWKLVLEPSCLAGHNTCTIGSSTAYTWSNQILSCCNLLCMVYYLWSVHMFLVQHALYHLTLYSCLVTSSYQ